MKNKYVIVFFSSNHCGVCQFIKIRKQDEDIKKICKKYKVEYIEICVENKEKLNSIHPIIAKDNIVRHLPYFMFALKDNWENHSTNYLLAKEIPYIRGENPSKALKEYIEYYEKNPLYEPKPLKL